MSRRGGNVSIKQIQEAAETAEVSEDGTITTINLPTVVNNASDVHEVIETMISNDTILDLDDVNAAIDTKLTDYTTKTLLENTLDNYTSKELLTQSLSDRPTYTTTDALTNTTTNHENRIKGLEDNFVSTTALTETLNNYSQSNHTHTLSQITDYTAPDLTPYATTSTMNTALSQLEAGINQELSGKSNVNHTHTTDEINYEYEEEETINDEIQTITKQKPLNDVLDSKALAIHTHTISDITDYTAPNLSTYARLDSINLFTQSQAIQSNFGTLGLTLIQTTKGESSTLNYHARNSNNVQRICNIKFLPNTDELDININDVNCLKVQQNITTINGDIVGLNVLANNETRLAACESSLSSHTHSINDITDYSPPDVPIQEVNNDEFLIMYGDMKTSRNWSSICYGEGKGFVAVAKNSTQYGAYSSDGITWQQIDLKAARNWYSVCYGEGKGFVAIAESSSQYGAYSSDGITWQQMDMKTSRDWKSVCYGDDKFVAVANGSRYGAYSYDGMNWEQMDMNNSRQWWTVCYGDGKFVAIITSTDTSYGAYSTDGINNWQQISLPYNTQSRSITYANNTYVLVANSNSKILYSTDGVTWQQTSAIVDSNINWFSVCYGNGKFVAVTASHYVYIAYSIDGITWKNLNKYLSAGLMSVCYGDGKFVAVGNNTRYCVILSDKIRKIDFPLISTANTICSHDIYQILPTLEQNRYIRHYIGKNLVSYNYGNLGFKLAADATNTNYLCLGINENEIFRVYASKIESSYSITNTSDRRLKENIEEIHEDESKNIIDNLKVYSFNLKYDPDEPKRKRVGVIAQELKELAPYLVYEDGSEDNYLSVDYTSLIPHLINKIHSQDKKIQELEAKINQMINEITQIFTTQANSIKALSSQN